MSTILSAGSEWYEALRRHARRPFTTVCATVALTAGIAVATPIVSYLDHALIRPLPFFEPDQIMVARVLVPQKVGESLVGVEQVEALQSVLPPLVQLGAFASAGHSWLDDVAAPSPIAWCFLDASAVRVLGVSPVIGRIFTQADERSGEQVALISYGLWQRAYAGQSTVLDQYLSRGSARYHVVGVMPKGFAFPRPTADVWAPFPTRNPQQAVVLDRRLIARVSRDTTRAVAAARSERVLRETAAFSEARVSWVPVADTMSVTARTTAPLLIVGFLAALGLSTVVASELLLTEAMRSRVDVGIKLALGASRVRVLRGGFLRGLSIAAAAGGAGVLASSFLSHSVAPDVLVPLAVPGEMLDGRVIGAVAVACALIGATIGTLPALAYGSSDIRSLLGSTRLGPPRQVGWIKRGLCSGRMCCATVFVVCGALTWVSIKNLNGVSPGFVTDRLLTVAVLSPQLLSLPVDEQVRSSAQFFDTLVLRARRLPGVVDAAVTSTLPMLGGGAEIPFSTAASPPGCETAQIRGVSESYFRTLGLPLESGRLFAEEDRSAPERVAIVNEALARRCWPDRSALGGVGGFGQERWRVVGVVRNVRMEGLREPPVPELYVPMHERALGFLYVLLRVRGNDPYTPLPAFRSLVRTLDRQARVSSIRSMEDILAGAEAPLSLRATLLAHAAFGTFIVALLGIYGTTALVARQRRREQAIRVALGATPATLVARGVLDAVVWSLPGVLGGMGAAFWVGSSLAPFLYGVDAFEPWIYMGSALFLCFTAAAAAWGGGRELLDADLLRCLRVE